MKTEHDYIADLAIRNGAEALQNARSVLERALKELDYYTERYDSQEDFDDKGETLNAALHHLTTFVPSNVRLDLLANAQARLAYAKRQS
ncbi:hypothetical protein [Orrella sp. 11846]|uniref:hypothetical protein n=1 Tax=Orrella sp. 11846 TaxID=3409913 RepID=UPI003B5A5252